MENIRETCNFGLSKCLDVDVVHSCRVGYHANNCDEQIERVNAIMRHKRLLINIFITIGSANGVGCWREATLYYNSRTSNHNHIRIALLSVELPETV